MVEENGPSVPNVPAGPERILRKARPMDRRYEADGVLEDGRLIRLRKRLPCREGPVKVVVTLTGGASSRRRNLAALKALDRLLAAPDDLPPERWEALEKLLAVSPLRIRKGRPS